MRVCVRACVCVCVCKFVTAIFSEHIGLITTKVVDKITFQPRLNNILPIFIIEHIVMIIKEHLKSI